MTIDEIMTNFRAALADLATRAERVGIPWKRPDAYDEWDELTAAVFNTFVVHPLRWTLPEPDRDGFRLPDYDLLLPNYSGISLIEVLPSDITGIRQVFHALGTTHAPFDTVEAMHVSADGIPQSKELTLIPFIEAEFALINHGKQR